MAEQKTWEIKVMCDENGGLHIERNNYGFSILELFGLNSLIKNSLDEQVKSMCDGTVTETLSCNGKILSEGERAEEVHK